MNEGARFPHGLASNRIDKAESLPCKGARFLSSREDTFVTILRREDSFPPSDSGGGRGGGEGKALRDLRIFRGRFVRLRGDPQPRKNRSIFQTYRLPLRHNIDE